MGYFISKTVEVCSYEEVNISIEDIIDEANEDQTKKIIIGLIREYPNLIHYFISESEEKTKLYPIALKEKLIEKYQKENKPLKNFI